MDGGQEFDLPPPTFRLRAGGCLVLLGHLVLAAAQQGVEAVQEVVQAVVVATRDAKAGGYLVEGGQEEVAQQQEVAVVVARKPVSVLALLAAVQRELAVRKPSARVLYLTGGTASYVWSFRQ